jgi:hypothetical protein
LGRVALEQALGDLVRVVEDVPAVEDLHGVGRAQRRAAGVLRRAIADDDLDARMLRQPGGQARPRPLGQQVDRAARLQVDEHGPEPQPASPGPIVDAEHARRGGRAVGAAPQEAQERVAADAHADAAGQPGAGLPAQRRAEGGEHRLQPLHSPAVRRGDAGHLLGEGAPRAPRPGADEAPDRQPHAHRPPAGRQVPHSTLRQKPTRLAVG